MNPTLTFPRAAAAARANARSKKPVNVMDIPEVKEHFEAWKQQCANEIFGASANLTT